MTFYLSMSVRMWCQLRQSLKGVFFSPYCDRRAQLVSNVTLSLLALPLCSNLDAIIHDLSRFIGILLSFDLFRMGSPIRVSHCLCSTLSNFAFVRNHACIRISYFCFHFPSAFAPFARYGKQTTASSFHQSGY